MHLVKRLVALRERVSRYLIDLVFFEKLLSRIFDGHLRIVAVREHRQNQIIATSSHRIVLFELLAYEFEHLLRLKIAVKLSFHASYEVDRNFRRQTDDTKQL